MWKIYRTSRSTASAQKEGATVLCLEFADAPLYLVEMKEASSTDLEPRSQKQGTEDMSYSSDSKQTLESQN